MNSTGPVFKINSLYGNQNAIPAPAPTPTMPAKSESDIYRAVWYINVYNPTKLADYANKNLQYTQERADVVEAVLDIMTTKGKGAIDEVFAFHPDKELILEIYGRKGGSSSACESDCTCNSCKTKRFVTSKPFMIAAGIVLLLGAFYLIYQYAE